MDTIRTNFDPPPHGASKFVDRGPVGSLVIDARPTLPAPVSRQVRALTDRCMTALDTLHRKQSAIPELDTRRGRHLRTRAEAERELERGSAGARFDGTPSAHVRELRDAIATADSALAKLNAERAELVAELEAYDAVWSSLARLITRIGEHYGVRSGNVLEISERLRQ